MGQEIQSSQYDKHDFSRFRQRLIEETSLLSEYFRNDRFCSESDVGGFEIEACLIDQDSRPAPRNAEFIKRLNSPLVVPELALFNVELNSSPQPLSGPAFETMLEELVLNLKKCSETAEEMSIKIIMIGILPTIKNSDLELTNISDMNRYHALNEEILKMRNGLPLYLHINGKDTLALAHTNVLVEAATTSFQVHLQIDPRQSARIYNAATIASAPVVAACANSPFMFGKRLWQETRIPLFEQSVDVGDPDRRRVTFGSGYVRGSIMECFEENLEKYPVLIPGNTDDELSTFSHVRFHNGTIWRWNRPLIGIDQEGSVHLRIEHRVIPAGPTAIDGIANAALFYGLCSYLAGVPEPPENILGFDDARDNFYRCAEFGLDADVIWLDNRKYNVSRLLLDIVIPCAKEGLNNLGIDESSVNKFMGIIHERILSGQNGSVWQTRYVQVNAADMSMMCRAYHENQLTGLPVHEWNTKC